MAVNTQYVDSITQIISDFISHPLVLTVFIVILLSVFLFMRVYPYLENLR